MGALSLSLSTRLNTSLPVVFFRGLKPVPDEEVLEMYDGTHHIPLHQASGFYGKVSYFANPQVCLWTNPL